MNDSIVILASRSQTSYLLINHLAQQFEVAQVVFEAPHSRKMLRYRLRTLGYWKVAGQLAFLVYDRLVIRRRSKPRIAQLLQGYNTSAPDARLPVMEVDSVNGTEVAALLEKIQPRVVVVSGTGIIAKRILKLAPTFINIHVGITPRYRGVHGGFWAIYEGRPELAGTTIHRVDPGVDTGAIVAQTTITVDPTSDTYRTLPVKQYLAALDLMVKSVQAALDGTLQPYNRDDLGSQQWYSPTPAEYLRFLAQMRKLRRKLTNS
jgi:folate-dependent phosphoribosylglycinamide formyltransferase PurN